MLGRRLDALTETDLQQAALARVPETQHLDFKQLLDDSDKHRDSFASDVCAFANAGGGVILYGIAEDGSGHARKADPVPQAARRASAEAAWHPQRSAEAHSGVRCPLD